MWSSDNSDALRGEAGHVEEGRGWMEKGQWVLGRARASPKSIAMKQPTKGTRDTHLWAGRNGCRQLVTSATMQRGSVFAYLPTGMFGATGI